MDWKTQYCKNVHTTQINLQIHGNPYQITNCIFHRTKTKILICMETEKTLETKNKFEKEQQSWRHHSPWLCVYYKSTVIRGVWFWHKKDIDQWNDRKPRNKLTHCDQLIHNKGGMNTHGEKTVSSITGAGKTGQLHVK